MNILIVDGYQIMRKTMIRYLELQRYFEKVLEANTVRNAKMILQEEKVDVLLLDIQLPDSSGLDLVQFSKNLDHKPVIILCSNYGMPQYINTYDYLSVNFFFDKSSELTELKNLIRKIVQDQKFNSGQKRNHKQL